MKQKRNEGATEEENQRIRNVFFDFHSYLLSFFLASFSACLLAFLFSYFFPSFLPFFLTQAFFLPLLLELASFRAWACFPPFVSPSLLAELSTWEKSASHHLTPLLPCSSCCPCVAWSSCLLCFSCFTFAPSSSFASCSCAWSSFSIYPHPSCIFAFDFFLSLFSSCSSCLMLDMGRQCFAPPVALTLRALLAALALALRWFACMTCWLLVIMEKTGRRKREKTSTWWPCPFIVPTSKHVFACWLHMQIWKTA